MKADGITLTIRGTRSADMPRLPMESGGVWEGQEFWLPIQEWSDADVFAYLRQVGAPICQVYETLNTLPECARCSAWWGEKRAAYLRQHHPEVWRDYSARLRIVFEEMRRPLEELTRELENADGVGG